MTGSAQSAQMVPTRFLLSVLSFVICIIRLNIAAKLAVSRQAQAWCWRLGSEIKAARTCVFVGANSAATAARSCLRKSAKLTPYLHSHTRAAKLLSRMRLGNSGTATLRDVAPLCRDFSCCSRASVTVPARACWVLPEQCPSQQVSAHQLFTNPRQTKANSRDPINLALQRV